MSDGRARSGPARFDSTLGAWILSNHADVSAALRDVRLSAVATAAGDAPGHAAVRRTAARDFSPERLAAWCAETAAKHVARIPVGRPVDLVREFAAPWSLALAAKAACPTGGDMEAARLSALAREVFLAAATATDSTVSPRALAASAELAQSLQRATAEASIDVQAFVA
ncbi:MAG TPA: hypothetical protein VK636_20045, partial [Gemmatimonadaceae bacterium]|nr:hypothetical protein [Gemmatimonadaceae bacterium]